jgi:hypothetical protein
MRLLLASPFLPPFYDGLLTERKTVLQILQQSGDLAWCEDFVVVRLNGVTIAREQWPRVTVKPEAAGLLELCVVPQKGNLLPILASVALVALTAGIGAGFAAPFLGASFAAGTFGSAALAAGVGIAGQIAISALTAPPSVASGAGKERDLSQAGISANVITLLQTLPTLHGKMLVSPPVISPPYTTFDADELTVHAIVGIEGRCLIENILVNGIDIARFESTSYETREGGPASAVLTLAQLTCIQQTDQVTLSKFRTEARFDTLDPLIDQVTPANSVPDFHPFTTDGAVNEFWVRLLMPAGLVNTITGANAAFPLRMEIRKVGDVTWRKFPTMHITDNRVSSGPLRVEIKVKFQTQASGRHFSNAGNTTVIYPIFELTNITGIGQVFEYQSDAYFQLPAYVNPGDDLPIMTAATTSSFTMSASSELTTPGNAAWRAADGSLTQAWQPADNSLPAWLKIQPPSARTYRSYHLSFANSDTVPTTAALTWYVEGSNNDVNWTRLDAENVDISAFPLSAGEYQIGSPGSYVYYRLNFLTNNGAANAQIAITDIRMHTFDAIGIAAGHDTASFDGFPALHSSGGDPRSVYGSLDRNGATFYLDPAQWPPGAYEVRLQRGRTFDLGNFGDPDYSYGGADGSDFFEYVLSGGLQVIRFGQKFYRDDAVVEVFSSVSQDVPVDTTGIACIAIEMKNTVIDSISAEMTSYAQPYSAGVWADTEVPTANPAALYRKAKLGAPNPNPPPGEILNEDELAAWFTRCAAAGHEVNFLQQGRSMAEVLGVIAYAGFASPRNSNLESIVEDYDRSAESISQMLSPLNSKLLGVNIPLPDLEHAIYAEYFDAADDWIIRRDIIYRDGFDSNTATFFTTITYDGFTNTAKVAARAAFDLKQVVLRARTVRREIGMEGYSLFRGKLVGHNDDVLNTTQAQGLIAAITTSGANVVSITVDNIIPFAVNQDELAAFAEGLDLANATGVAIRRNDGSAVVKTLINVSDGNICTFTTPFALAGSEIEVGQKAVFGRAGQEYSRMIVMGIEPQGIETRIVTLAAEAPELFA